MGKKAIRANFGQSYLGNLYAVSMHFPVRERWMARRVYTSNWFHRHLWLLIGVPLLFILSLLKDKFFPRSLISSKASSHFQKFFDILLIVILSVVGLTILVLLLAYFFL